MKIFLTKTLLVLTVFIPYITCSQNKSSPDDLSLILGQWEGTLTYMDYSTNKPYSMPANVLVEKGKNKYQLKLLFSYPEEPNANSKEKIKISTNGLLVNNAEVRTRQELENNEIQITTQSSGKDNNKNALIKNIYVLGKDRFIIRKEVKYEYSDDWIVRNEYKFFR